MVHAVSGAAFTAIPRASRPHHRRIFRGVSLFFTPYSPLSRKVMAGKSFHFTTNFSVAVSDKEHRTAKCKIFNSAEGHKPTFHLNLLNQSKKTCTNFSNFQILEASTHSYLKFLLGCGLFTLQSTGIALASSDVASSVQSFSLLGDLSDISTGFASAFLLIFFSELGDKTFFIAALLAARNSAAITFIGTFGALGVMTVISVVLGRTFHYVDGVLPFRFGDADLPIDDLAAVCLLVYFGVSSLIEASSSDGLKAEEEQKEAEVAVSEFSGGNIVAAAASTFALVFVAEWGDKSFFSTIALAAASSPVGVIGGALAGHGVATLVAVVGGSFLGTFLSDKVIGYVGGTLFLLFAALTLLQIFMP